ncbi:MAG: Gfo/Idh/MocA family oxidoreductase [Anaerolineaceae bacterium]|nr:Gfo/Idh/MocA family oxidoreductase [Anaerolineaceae bacterium]
MHKKISLVIIGLGSRGKNAYGTELLNLRDRAEVVAVADPNEERLAIGGNEHNIPPERRYHTAEELLAQPKLADAALICTQDRQHVGHAVAALRKGYDVLLEKPVSPDLSELQKIVRVAREENRSVVVCHVLRYTPFFQLIKETIDSGRLGRVVNIQALENVRYWHQAHSFVRGNWRRSEETSPMILAKCCHDLDYLIWLCGSRCEKVSSFGSLIHFKPENAPEGAAARCLDGCRAKENCPYDAEKIYLYNKDTGVLEGNTEWPVDILSENPTEETIREAIQNGPYGRCVYACDNDVVDNQIVNMQMENGAALSLMMSAFTSIGGRTIKVMGTMGDLWGDMNRNIIRICEFGKEPEIIDFGKPKNDFNDHGGGDRGLILSFLDYLEGKKTDNTITTLETSIESHLAALAAEESRLKGGMPIDIAPLRG